MVYVKFQENWCEEAHGTEVFWGVRVEAEKLARFLLKWMRTETDFLAQEFDYLAQEFYYLTQDYHLTMVGAFTEMLEDDPDDIRKLFRPGVAAIRHQVSWTHPDWDAKDNDSGSVIFGFRIAGADKYDLLDEYNDQLPPPGGQYDYRFTKLANSTRPKCLDAWTLPYEVKMSEFFNVPLEIHVGVAYCDS